MANIKLILFISLSLIAISSEALIIDNVDENDMNKCQAPNEIVFSLIRKKYLIILIN